MKKAKYRLCWHNINEHWDLSHIGRWQTDTLQHMKKLCDYADGLNSVNKYWIEKKCWFSYKRVYG